MCMMIDSQQLRYVNRLLISRIFAFLGCTEAADYTAEAF
jgi:hypothetical protein